MSGWPSKRRRPCEGTYEDATGVVLTLERELDPLARGSGGLEGDLEGGNQVGQAQRGTLADLVVVNLDPEEEVGIGVGVIIVGGEAQGVVAVRYEIGDGLGDDTVVGSDGTIPDPLCPPVPTVNETDETISGCEFDRVTADLLTQGRWEESREVGRYRDPSRFHLPCRCLRPN